MIKITTYKQTDLRWRWKKVGFGKGNFGNIGCTITCLTSLLSSVGYTLRPDEVAYLLRLKNGFIGDLLIWSKISVTFPRVKFLYRYYKYDNSIALKSIKKNMPVLVEVMTKYGKHWCLYIGNQLMLDPLSGIVSTSKYSTRIGMATFEKA